MQPKVSVIVPVYNAEPYLRRCVDSILGQTLTDIEVILVDDGSTDSSGAIVDGYAARDGRVVAIHTENRGTAAAQHTGARVARGSYLTVYDNDDFVPTKALELLYEQVEARGADLVVGDFLQSAELDSPDIVPVYHELGTGDIAPFEALKLLLTGRWRGALWAQLFRRELYLQAVRDYPTSHYAQDFVAMLQLFCHARKMVRLDKPVYCWTRRRGSLLSHWSQWSPERRREHGIITSWALDTLEKHPDKALFAGELAFFALVRTSYRQILNFRHGLDPTLSPIDERVLRDYYPDRAARRRLRRTNVKRYIFLMAERHAGWRAVRDILWRSGLKRIGSILRKFMPRR